MKRQIREPAWLKYMRSKGYSTEEALNIRLKEHIVKKLSNTKFAKNLYIVNLPYEASDRITYYYYENPVVSESDGFVPGGKLTRSFAEDFFTYIKIVAAPEVVLDGEIVSLDTGYEFLIKANQNNMYTPLKIRIIPMSEAQSDPDKVEYRLISSPAERIEFLIYPLEAIIGNDIAEILSKLELMYDMNVYADVLKLTSQVTIDGTRISVRMKEACEEKNVPITEDRLKLFLTYKDNKILKTKWNKYIKRQKSMSIKWETVISRLDAFISPVWEKLCDGQIFFGDWMPELGRYLNS